MICVADLYQGLWLLLLLLSRFSCVRLCDPIDGSPPGSTDPGILQARTLEQVAISFSMHESEKWKWSRSVVSDSQRPHGLQPTRLLHPWDFPGKSTGVGCHCLLRKDCGGWWISLGSFSLLLLSKQLTDKRGKKKKKKPKTKIYPTWSLMYFFRCQI